MKGPHWEYLGIFGTASSIPTLLFPYLKSWNINTFPTPLLKTGLRSFPWAVSPHWSQALKEKKREFSQAWELFADDSQQGSCHFKLIQWTTHSYDFSLVSLQHFSVNTHWHYQLQGPCEDPELTEQWNFCVLKGRWPRG